MEKVNLDEIKRQYPSQWIAFLVSEEKPTGEIVGELIAHNSDRRDLHEELRNKKIRKAYVTFAGPVVKPGYAVIL